MSSRAVSEIASEIIVQGDEMDVDEKLPPASEAQSADGSHVEYVMGTRQTVPRAQSFLSSTEVTSSRNTL